MVHPTAIVHPAAVIGAGCVVGPYCVIEAGVTLAENCILAPHVHLLGNTRIGANNTIHSGAVIGDLPQDLRFQGGETGVVIGSNNTIREHVTIHRSNKTEEPTTIGSHCFLMSHSHVGHNTRVGDHVIMANGALLGGHVIVQDRAFISGNCLVHQFVRVGTLALMQGGSAISKDLPPFTISRGDNSICGLNIVGLRRAGVGSEERLELRRLYHFLFRSGRNVRVAAKEARTNFSSRHASLLLQFIADSKRGVLVSRDRAMGRETEE